VTQANAGRPDAGAAQGSGRYGSVRAGAAACTTASGARITLPTSFAPDATTSACRYTGTGTTWDCSQNGFTGSSVSRWYVTQPTTDWAVAKGPLVTIDNRTVTEGNSGTKAATYTVKLSAPSMQTVTVNYATADGTALSTSDYQAQSGTLTFAPGVTSMPVTVQVNGDTLYEKNETFFVDLTSPVNAFLSTAQGKGTITNDDPVPSISIGDASKLEGNTGTSTLKFTVTLSALSGLAATVHYATADGSATAGSDYVARSGTLTIPAGTTTKTIAITINGDTTAEPDETFFINLTTPVNATIPDAQATGTIQNDD